MKASELRQIIEDRGNLRANRLGMCKKGSDLIATVNYHSKISLRPSGLKGSVYA